MFAQYFAQSVKTWPGMDNMSVCPNQELAERCVKGDCSADDKGDVRSHITEFRGWRQGIESIHPNLLAGCVIRSKGLTVSPIAITIMTIITGVDT
jgi:hypothetical protein